MLYPLAVPIKPFSVYGFVDTDGDFTNVRSSPNGGIIMKLENKDTWGCQFDIVAHKNGWLKFNNMWSTDEYTISDISAWIHISVVGVATRKDVTVLNEPNGKEKIGVIEQESGAKIKDVCANWVKIEHNGIVGWVESEWLCGNPVTTCP